jgi:Spy/CpxP family protein refolding chaperone
MKPLMCLMVAALLVLPVGCAQNPPYRSSHHGQPSVDELAGELDLSAAQKTQVQQILDRERAQREELWQSGAQLTPESRRQQMQALQSDLINRLSAVLTPEQLQKFEQLEQQRRHHGHRFGGYREDPGQ